MTLVPMMTETASTANAETISVSFGRWNGTHFVHTESPVEKAARQSNQCAELAMYWGLAGREITAEAFAELADVYSLVAHQIAGALLMTNGLPGERVWLFDNLAEEGR